MREGSARPVRHALAPTTAHRGQPARLPRPDVLPARRVHVGARREHRGVERDLRLHRRTGINATRMRLEPPRLRRPRRRRLARRQRQQTTQTCVVRLEPRHIGPQLGRNPVRDRPRPRFRGGVARVRHGITVAGRRPWSQPRRRPSTARRQRPRETVTGTGPDPKHVSSTHPVSSAILRSPASIFWWLVRGSPNEGRRRTRQRASAPSIPAAPPPPLPTAHSGVGGVARRAHQGDCGGAMPRSIARFRRNLSFWQRVHSSRQWIPSSGCRARRRA